MFLALVIICCLGNAVSFSQNAGDFRSAGTGDWSNLAIWQTYNGSSWIGASTIPDTLGHTTIQSGDSVSVTTAAITYVGASTIATGAQVAVIGVGDSTVRLRIANGTMTVVGTLTQTGGPAPSPGPYAIGSTSSGALVIGNEGTFRQDQNGPGQIPAATWDDGSTLLVTGIIGATNIGGAGGLSYYNITWNCPNQTANTSLSFNPPAQGDITTTVRGDLNILNTGIGRAQFTSPQPGDSTTHTISRVIVDGDINVLNGAVFTAHGTSSAYTDIHVTVYGNITVRDSFEIAPATWRFAQLSISRGSQGTTGTTTWYIHSDSVTYGRKTTNQNSTDPNTGTTTKGKFIFMKSGTQVISLDDSIAWTGKCNMQFGDGIASTIVNIGNSAFSGSACHQRIKSNATVIVGENGSIGGGTNSNSIPSDFAMESGSTLMIASQNGIRATGSGSSGAIRVSGNRDYGTASNFVYNGTSHQRLGSGFPASANNLTLNNSAGAFIDSVAGFTINGTLTVTSGDLDLNGKTITLGATGLLAETAGNTVTGTSGVITTTRSLNAPLVTTDIAGMGVGIGSAADLGSTVITRGHGTQPVAGTSIKRWFDLTPTTNTGLNASLKFHYDDSELNSFTESDLELYKSTDVGSTWTLAGGTVNTSLNTIDVSGLNDLSRWSAAGAYTVGVPIVTGWNMISNPVSTPDDSVLQVYPTSSFGYAFAFNPTSGYQQQSVMQNGTGYWGKFPGATTQPVSGSPIPLDSIDVVVGWNMIGSISVAVDTADVIQIPAGIVSSNYFGYNGAYSSSATIQPGKAYWVKINAPGKLVLPSSAPSRNARREQTGVSVTE